MKKEIIINATSTEIRVAITEDDRLAELFLELPDKERHVGSIYLGRVQRVVQGMNAAFVDIGEEQDAFLHFSDAGNAGDDYKDMIDDDDEEDDEAAKPHKGKPEKKGKKQEQGKAPQKNERRDKEAHEPQRDGKGDRNQQLQRNAKPVERGTGDERANREPKQGGPKRDDQRRDGRQQGKQRTDGTKHDDRKREDGQRDDRKRTDGRRDGGKPVDGKQGNQRQTNQGGDHQERPDDRDRKRDDRGKQQRNDRSQDRDRRRDDRPVDSPKEAVEQQATNAPAQGTSGNEERANRRPNNRRGGRGKGRDNDRRNRPDDRKGNEAQENKTAPSPIPDGQSAEGTRPERSRDDRTRRPERRGPKSRPESDRTPDSGRQQEQRRPSDADRAEPVTAGTDRTDQANNSGAPSEKGAGSSSRNKRPQRRSSGRSSNSGNAPEQRDSAAQAPATSVANPTDTQERSSLQNSAPKKDAQKGNRPQRRPTKKASNAGDRSQGSATPDESVKPRPKDSATSSPSPQQSSTEERPAAARNTSSRNKPSAAKGGRGTNADAKAETKKDSSATTIGAGDGGEEKKPRPKPRGRGGRGGNKSGGGNSGSGSATMDAKLPTFQTKRSGEVTIALEKGQEILVQVTRESYASKGVKVSTKVSLPGRFLVLLPLEPFIGISRKVMHVKERRRLRSIARGILPEGFGCIIRTVAQDKDSEMLEQELRTLLGRWREIEQKLKGAKAPLALYQDQSIANTVMRDLFTPDISRVVIDNKTLYEEIRDYVEWAAPPLADKIEHYKGNDPIFETYNVEKELEKMYGARVYVPSGGYIIMEQTEAMMVIDVNSGRFASNKEQELNSLRTNLECAREIARQIRLRDVGGLIVIDFIDLYDEKNRKKIYDELKKEMWKDRAKSVVLPMTQFGIVQMTRQRIRQQLVQTISEPCPVCSGKGLVQSKSTVVRKMERWLQNFRDNTREFRLTLTANPHLIDYLTEGDTVSRLTKIMLKYFVRIKVAPDEGLQMEDFKFYSIRQQMDVTEKYAVID